MTLRNQLLCLGVMTAVVLTFDARPALATDEVEAVDQSKMSVVVFPPALDGIELSAQALSSLHKFFMNRLSTEGVYDVVPADVATKAEAGGTAWNDCRDRVCMIGIGRVLLAGGLVSVSISVVDSKCRFNAVLREVTTGESRAVANGVSGCSAGELTQTAMFVAAQLSGQFGREIISEKAVTVQTKASQDSTDSMENKSAPETAGNEKAEKELPIEPVRDIKWISIAGGTFFTGGDCDVFDADCLSGYEVTVRPFEMTETEVTMAQYSKCVDAGECTAPHFDDRSCYVWTATRGWKAGILPKKFRGINQPVVCVDRDQAEAFARWAGARLPTGAQWEFAARSGQERLWPWGDEKATCKLAVMAPAKSSPGHRSTRQACSRPEGNTEAGLCDMAGNAWEMVTDTEPAPKKAGKQVIRGGCWRSGPDQVKTTYRGYMGKGYRDGDVGFRIVRTPAETAK